MNHPLTKGKKHIVQLKDNEKLFTLGATAFRPPVYYLTFLNLIYLKFVKPKVISIS